MPIKIFFCYAHEDETLLNKLKAQLKSLQRQGHIDVWHDRDISVGTEWEQEIKRHLHSAEIILLLISPDFMDSDYCYSVEMKQAIGRHKQGEACIVPIILRPVHWQEEPLNMLQALPTGAKPVTSWSNLDEALFDVASGIRMVIKEEWLKKSNTYYKTEFYGEALQAITQAIKLDTHDVQLYKMEGQILQRLGRIDDSLAAYERVLLKEPNDVSAYSSKGMLLNELGRYDDAISACTRAIELDSGHAPAFYTRGKALQALARYQEALEAYEQTIHIDPDKAEPYESKGQVLELFQQYAEAVLAYEQATKIDPTNPHLYYAQGMLLRKLNRDEDALATFERAILLDANNVQFLKEKAITLQRLKRVDEARDLYKKARQLTENVSLIEVMVENINVHEKKNLGIIILKEAKQNRFLHIKATAVEALGITDQPQRVKYEQLPRLCQVIQNIIVGLGASIAEITISGLIEENFYGNIVLKIVDKQVEFDMHVVDAIALALHTQTPIFVEEDIWEVASTNVLPQEEDESEVAQALLKEEPDSDAGQVIQANTVSDRNRFDKFTEKARKVLSLAQEEAQRLQHNYIGTEHLLLGLVREGEGVAAKVLANLGVELNKVRSVLEHIIGRGDRIVLGEIGLTPRAKKVVALAVDEARRLNHPYVGTEHLLLGLILEGECIGAGILESLKVNLENVRAQTLLMLFSS